MFLTHFLTSWRGFLLGSHRHWHAHHAVGVTGQRGGHLVSRVTHQEGQLRSAARLFFHLFTRGGRVWAFGFGAASVAWGLVRSVWRPGILSNYFYYRVRRLHFARRVYRSYSVRRRRRRQRVRLSRRWARLRQQGKLPSEVYSRRLRHQQSRRAGYARVERRNTVGAGLAQFFLSWSSAPHGGRARTRWFRTWWFRVGGYRRRGHRGGTTLRSVGLRSLCKLNLIYQFTRRVSHLQLKRSTRPGKSVPTRVTPAFFNFAAPPLRTNGRRRPPRQTRGGRRFKRLWVPRVKTRSQVWPLLFPAAVTLRGGSPGVTLLNEVSLTGAPLVLWGQVDLIPCISCYPVLWNDHSAEAVPVLMDFLHERAHRAGLFRVVWSRLAEW